MEIDSDLMGECVGMGVTMTYYCPYCGEEAYRGHREYKCANDECENHEEPIFGIPRKLDRSRYAGTPSQ